MKSTERYYSLSSYLKETYGAALRKVSIDAGFTCPTRDGTITTGGCAYCNADTLRFEDNSQKLAITEQINNGIARLGEKTAPGVIAYFQVNTNTYKDADTLKKLYLEAATHPKVRIVAVSTRPDCLEDSALDILEDIRKTKPVWLEMGLQSSNDATLKAINRGHTQKDFDDALKKAVKRNLDVCGHVILGLPGEDKETMLKSVRFLARRGIWGIKLHQLDIVKDTLFAAKYECGRIKTLSLDEYAEIVVESLELLPASTVIHRLSGDTKKELLVSPLWGLEKLKVKNKIEKLLTEKNTRQGAKY
ncbi:MAG: TIGR01212 family radical SAM protein [Deltaproteobacteria bacterium]|nr:TIGR01212 family radical SAM protein [Deltaproteobacteria bacterium]